MKNTPIGINIPLKPSSISGYFQQTFDTRSTYRANIINLLHTIPGERRFNYKFGCRLWKLLFEINNDALPDNAKSIIKDDISTWIHGVTVKSIDIISTENPSSDDIYKLRLYIQYSIDSLNVDDSVTINIS